MPKNLSFLHNIDINLFLKVMQNLEIYGYIILNTWHVFLFLFEEWDVEPYIIIKKKSNIPQIKGISGCIHIFLPRR